VHTEYGADAWLQVIEAGFMECRLVVLEFPAAIALLAAGLPGKHGYRRDAEGR
jgi:hypothetical protein